jgi:signal transduction histidine kinase
MALLTAQAGLTQPRTPPEAKNFGPDLGGEIETAFKQLSAVTAKNLTREQLAAELLTILYSLVPFDNGALYKRERATSFAMLGVSHHGAMLTQQTRAKRMNIHTLPLLHELILSRKPIYIADVALSPRWRPLLEEQTGGSWCGIPLVSAGILVGVLSLGSDKRDFFCQAHRSVLQVFSGTLAALTQNVILSERQSGSTSRLSQLTRQVITAQEEERKRVSRELHDEAGQSLTALSLNLELLQQDLVGQSIALKERARQSVEITRNTMERISNLARQLRPPALDTLGLHGAIEQLVRERQQRSGVKITLAGPPLTAPGDSTDLTLYRFVQEALTNVTKHANAKHVEIELEQSETEIRVRVHDDGKGFDPSENLKGPRRLGRLGLLGMRERLALVNGHLEIHSVPGDGTLLIAHVPIENTVERGDDTKRSEP